ncbi:MAG: hypothetical protein IKR78_05025 [Dehalococcoidales bacterium]|nr:hypothetical protein [Dehalococcoidales bacterium]
MFEDYVEGTPERLNAIEKSNVLAVSVALEGAMGMPGQVVIAESFPDRIDFIEFYDYDKLFQVIPWFSEVTDWLGGMADNYDPEWTFIYLGFGNNLFVRNDVFAVIKDDIDPEAEVGWLYNNWYQILTNRFVSK